ncbi:MAG: hypothetical protein L0Z50_27285 [Verrucomicrobiales bacterium]|nr:hypothetical protein [Verrucomicrobiales bacterium]
MKIIASSLIIVTAAGVGLTVGFFLRSKSGSPPAITESSEATAVSTVISLPKDRVAKQGSEIRSNDDSPLATRLERDLSMSSGVTRWLYWLEAIEKAALFDFPRLARLAQGNFVATQLIAARWVELDPRHLFDTVVAWSKEGRFLHADELASVLFQEWPKRDADAVIAALSGSDDYGKQKRWRMSVVSALFDTDVERGLRAMSEWSIRGFSPRMTAVAKWAAADPRHAAEFTFAHPDADNASQLTIETIGKEWARTDPGGALAFAASQRGELGSTLANTVLKDWAGRNLNEAADWLAQVDARTRNRLSSSFVEAWAKQDAGSALAWCESNLTGSNLAQAVGGVLKGAAERDIAGAAGLVSQMTPSPAQVEAALAVAKKWFPSFSSEKAVAPETLAWLGNLDANSLKRVVDGVQWQWSRNDPKSMIAFLATPSADHVATAVFSNLGRTMAKTNPSETLDWASGLPEARSLAAGIAAFSEWCRLQPAPAINWLNGLSSADSRRQSFFQDALARLAYDPQTVAHLVQMSDVDRATALSMIQKTPMQEDRRAKLLDLLKEPR